MTQKELEFPTDIRRDTDPRQILMSYLRSHAPKGTNWTGPTQPPDINDLEVLWFNRCGSSTVSSVRWTTGTGGIDFQIEVEPDSFEVYVCVPAGSESFEDYNDTVFTVPNTLQKLSESVFSGRVAANSPNASIFDTGRKIASRTFEDVWKRIIASTKVTVNEPISHYFDVYDWGFSYNKNWTAKIAYNSLNSFILWQFSKETDSTAKRVEYDLFMDVATRILKANGLEHASKQNNLNWANSKMEFSIKHIDKRHQSNVMSTILVPYENIVDFVQ